jgi:hypothetical protein
MEVIWATVFEGAEDMMKIGRATQKDFLGHFIAVSIQ